MGTLGSGCYGFNVLNANGETDQLPVAQLINLGAQSHGVLYFSEFQDCYNMAVRNQGAASDTFSSLRAPVAGWYELEFTVGFTNTAASSLVRVTINCDKGLNFGTGISAPGGTVGSYTIDVPQIVTLASATSSTTMSYRNTLFLDRDSYITLTSNTIFGTVTATAASNASRFSLRCISLENIQKVGSFT